jgi:DnaK suppressor protein
VSDGDALSEHALRAAQHRLELKRSELIDRLYRVRRDRQRAHEPPPAADTPPRPPLESAETLECAEVAASRELEDLRLALERIAAGKYGVCDHCGGNIEGLRLHVWPYGTKCEACGGGDDLAADPVTS